MRFCFAFLKVNKRYGDFAPIIKTMVTQDTGLIGLGRCPMKEVGHSLEAFYSRADEVSLASSPSVSDVRCLCASDVADETDAV